MLHGLVLNRVLSCATVALAVAAAAPAAARGDAAQVTVVSPGGAQQTLSLDALAGSEDVAGRAYAVRSPEGETSVTLSGFSLGAIVEAAGADPFSFSYLDVQRPGGGAVRLSRHQALDPGAFADGPPVVYPTPAGTGFLRPSSGLEDLNAGDSFEAPQGIAIVLGKGSPLRVRARASTVRTRPGVQVQFSAEVEGAGAGERLVYSWYFDDGGSATGAEAHHSFKRRGSYDVVVGVTTPGDSTGSSDVITVQVGAPIAGPDREGGGRDDHEGAPDHGAAAGGPSSGDVRPAGAGSPADTQETKSSASSPNPTVRSQLCPHSGKKCDLTGGRREAEPSKSADGAGGESVSGVLLTGSQAPARPEGPAPAARSGLLGEDRGGVVSLPGAGIGLLITGGLLGLGALAESRGAFPRIWGRNATRGAMS